MTLFSTPTIGEGLRMDIYTPLETPGPQGALVADRLPSPERLAWRRRRIELERRFIRSTPLGLRGTGKKLFRTLYLAFSRLLRLTGLYGLGWRNALDIRLCRLDLSFPNLPDEFDAYRILHLTDLHLDMLPGLGKAIVKAVAGYPVDLCVLTGDYRAVDDGPFEPVLAPLSEIFGAVRAGDGLIATLGNHDDHRMAEAIERMGPRVLVNETVAILRGQAQMHITGLDDVNRFYTPSADKALDSVPEGFAIALVHSPEMAERAAERGYSLYLCGHTHGGQICLPGGRPIFTRLVRNRRFAAGEWRCGEMIGYTSRGAGVCSLPLRYFSHGEVTLVTLRKGRGD